MQHMTDMMATGHNWMLLLTGLIMRYGAIIVFVFSFTEVIPPFSFVSPGIFVLIIAGTLAPTPGIFLLFVAAAVAGVTLGNMLLYRLGHFYGRGIAHYFHLTDERLLAVETFMKRFGRFDVFCGQFIGLIRPGIAFVAGTARMNANVYYSWMIASSILWALFYVSLGAFLHARLGLKVVAHIGALLFVIGCSAVLIQLVIMHRNRRNAAQH